MVFVILKDILQKKQIIYYVNIVMIFANKDALYDIILSCQSGGLLVKIVFM